MAEQQLYRVVLRCLLMAAGLIVVLLFVWQIVDLLVLVFGAVVIAVLLRAIADPITAHSPLGNHAAVAVAVVLVAGVIGIFSWVFGAQVKSQFSDLSQSLPDAWRNFEQRLLDLPGGERLISTAEQAAPSGTNVVSQIGNVLLTLGSAIADLLLLIFGAIFIAAQPSLYRRGLLKLVPKSSRALAAEALQESGSALRRWLLGQLVSMLLIGLLTGFGLWMIGLPSALALGMIAGFAEIVPYAGPVLASIPGLLLALLQGPEMALWTLFVYLAVQQIEGSLIMPIVQRKAVSLPPALTVFGIVAAGLVFGFVGLIFAAPLLVVVYVLVKRLYVREALETPTPIPGED